MLIELFILFQVIFLIIFFVAYFTHQEILWVVSLVIGGFLMVSSYNIEYRTYVFDALTLSYVPMIKSLSYPFLMAVNLIFSSLSLVLGLFDIFDKYISKTEAPEVGELEKD